MTLTILAVVAATLFGYAAWIIFFSSKKSADHRRISVPLEQLAADIWLKHNEEHRSFPIKSKEVADLFVSGNTSTCDKKETGSKKTALVPDETTATTAVMTADTTETTSDTVSKSLRSFMDDCYYPYLKIIEAQGVMPVIQALLDIIRQYGSAPSVFAGQTNDNESKDLRSVKD
ncbi:MAG: hypothetical protein WCQ90_06460, partial [Deltaproteobacteria bacterium]